MSKPRKTTTPQRSPSLVSPRQRRRREREIVRTARAVVRELGTGPDVGVGDIEREVCERLGLQFGQALIYSLHELVAARRRAERRQQLRRDR
jgi:hypothetical protein